MRLALPNSKDFLSNNNYNPNRYIYLEKKVSRVVEKSIILSFEKIHTDQLSTRRKYYFMGASALCLSFIIYMLINFLPAKSSFSIFDLNLTSSLIVPEETFNFQFDSNLDSTFYIESVIIAPFGKNSSAVQRVKPDQMYYKYAFTEIGEGEKEFPFAVKAIDNTGRESNWAEKTITIRICQIN